MNNPGQLLFLLKDKGLTLWHKQKLKYFSTKTGSYPQLIRLQILFLDESAGPCLFNVNNYE